MHKFFVYGTLKVGGYFAKYFDGMRKTSKIGKLENFDLFRIGNVKASWFPGIVPGDGTVTGEIHEYLDEEEVLDAMDRIEGYNSINPKFSLYTREIREIELEDGTTEKAYVYVYNREVHDYFDKIEDGVWEI